MMVTLLKSHGLNPVLEFAKGEEASSGGKIHGENFLAG
jgi:hypothetical protein